MSTALTLPANLLSLAQAKAGPAAALTAQYAALTSRKVPRIALGNGRFRIVSDSGAVMPHSELHLDLVLGRVDDNGSRTWWEKSFDGGEGGAPDCFSVDAKRPDPKSRNIPIVLAGGVSRPAQTCDECPKNQKGSFDGGKSERKACSWKRNAVVYAPGQIGKSPYLISFGSLSWTGGKDYKDSPDGKPVKDYISWLHSAGANPGMVVTRFKYDANQKVAALLASVATDARGSALLLTAEEQQALVDAYNSPETLDLLRIAAQSDDAAPAPAAAPLPPPAAPVAAPPAPVAAPPAPVAAPPAPAAAPPAPVAAPPAPVAAPATEKVAGWMSALAAAFPDVYADAEVWMRTAAEAEVADWLKEEYPEVLEAAAPKGEVAPSRRPPARRKAAAATATAAAGGESVDALSARLGLGIDV